MVEFLYGSALMVEIQKILAEANGCFAVAFWGDGAAKKLHQGGQGDFRAICNLASGGTNPSEIRKLKRQNIRQSDTLHAKVYIGSESVVIGSANISTNGLGLEGIEQARWIEAGTSTHDTATALKWFEGLWDSAREITDGDIKKAEEAWSRRQKFRPTLLSIDDLDISSSDLPLLTWFEVLPCEVNPKAVKTYGLNEEIIKDSIGIESAQDVAALKPGRWVLYWYANDEGRPFRRNPQWFYTGRLIQKALRYETERNYRDVVIQSDIKPAVPFKFDKVITRLFYDVLSRSDFDELRSHDYDTGWYTKTRLGLIRRFWAEFVVEYKAQIDKK